MCASQCANIFTHTLTQLINDNFYSFIHSIYSILLIHSFVRSHMMRSNMLDAAQINSLWCFMAWRYHGVAHSTHYVASNFHIICNDINWLNIQFNNHRTMRDGFLFTSSSFSFFFVFGPKIQTFVLCHFVVAL